MGEGISVSGFRRSMHAYVYLCVAFSFFSEAMLWRSFWCVLFINLFFASVRYIYYLFLLNLCLLRVVHLGALSVLCVLLWAAGFCPFCALLAIVCIVFLFFGAAVLRSFLCVLFGTLFS